MVGVEKVLPGRVTTRCRVVGLYQASKLMAAPERGNTSLIMLLNMLPGVYVLPSVVCMGRCRTQPGPHGRHRYAMTLLIADPVEGEDPGIEDTFERYNRWN